MHPEHSRCSGYIEQIGPGIGNVRLTSLSHGAGCACKIGAAELATLRSTLPTMEDPNLLVGLDPADDAAVYRLGPDVALVQTIDFFTPIVDDPFDFGRIAAANALSDVYAMGGTPVLALNVLAASLESLGSDAVAAILQGGATIAAEAGIAVAGGHSIDDPEPKYGMAVSGTVDPAAVLTKAGARPGDVLHLSKPIGGGLVATAAKRGLADEDSLTDAIEVMTTLNRDAAAEAEREGVRAMTDVTGFGLLGHLHEMCRAGGVAAKLRADAVPAIAGALDLAEDPRCRAGGSRRNAEHAAGFTQWADGVSARRRVLMTDAMTSGGLLAAFPPGAEPWGGDAIIGEFVSGSSGRIDVA